VRRRQGSVEIARVAPVMGEINGQPIRKDKLSKGGR
jgi:hypothetical protein